MNNDLDKVINGGFCIGCGSCAVANNNNDKLNKLKIATTNIGTYKPAIVDIEDMSQLDSSTCPFSNKSKKDADICKELYGDIPNISHYKHIGYYIGLYAGHVKNMKIRQQATSGGLSKWILGELLRRKLIDGVIHVVRVTKQNSKNTKLDIGYNLDASASIDSDSNTVLFKYDIARSVEEVYAGSQSAYYPNNYADVLQSIKEEKEDKKYMFIGIPCYCKSIRLLCEKDPILAKRITYVAAILCGHMKSMNYVKFMAWASGLNPHDISYANFRHKNNKGRASNYKFHAKDSMGNESLVYRNQLYGGNYNIPHMKYKACDFCEDVFGYCADIVLGDAWLPKYNRDPHGTNVVISRHPVLDSILKEANGDNIIHIDELTHVDIIQSQSSSYSHRVEELGYRLYLEREKTGWVPDKAIQPMANLSSAKRERIQQLRMQIREKSHELFLDAILADDINIYNDGLAPYINELNSLYK